MNRNYRINWIAVLGYLLLALGTIVGGFLTPPLSGGTLAGFVLLIAGGVFVGGAIDR